jgi:hypothetical protein
MENLTRYFFVGDSDGLSSMMIDPEGDFVCYGAFLEASEEINRLRQVVASLEQALEQERAK